MNAMIEEILRQDPNGVVAILCPKKQREYLFNRFKMVAANNTSFSSDELGDRILLVPRTNGRFEFRRLLAMADVILDSWPWGGWTTTLQALAAKTPVITLPGNDARSRFTFGAYKTLGIDVFIAHNVEEFVHIALRAARDKIWRHQAMAKIQATAVEKLFETPETVICWSDFLDRAIRLARFC